MRAGRPHRAVTATNRSSKDAHVLNDNDNDKDKEAS